jgi:hypothetical protein
LWHTPIVADAEKRGVPRIGGGLAGQVHERAPEMWPTPTTLDSQPGTPSRAHRHHLRDVVARSVLTAQQRGLPNLDEWPVLFPTPTARDWRSGSHRTQAERGSSRGANLSEMAARLPIVVHDENAMAVRCQDQEMTDGQSRQVGTLNPTWVEWLMGFPIGWTELPPSATPSSPKL